MKKETGWVTTAAVAIAAVVGLSRLPSRSDGGAASPETPQVRKAANKEKLPNEASAGGKLPLACREIEGRLAKFLPKDQQIGPGSCFESGVAVPLKETRTSPPTLHFIVATLPDPVHTHFSLLFDRGAEAIHQAAQDEGYDYDSSWLPWIQETREYNTLKDQLVADDLRDLQEQQPGILVFRKSAATDGDPYREALIVFVAGENATGGVYDEQFKNAVAWIKALRSSGTGESFRVLSPIFSGSLPSLFKLLNDDDIAKFLETNLQSSSEKNAGNSVRKVEVMSGSVTSGTGIKWFHDRLLTANGGRFLSFEENDDVTTDRFCRYLHEQGYDTARLAIISEDETAYGAIAQSQRNPSEESSFPHCNYDITEAQKGKTEATPHGPLYLYYPRDIASLRAAYEKQSIAYSVTPQEQANQPRTTLQDDLSEPSNSEHDSIRTYGGEQTTLSQESSLFSVTNLLKSHRIQFIVLKSSNPLDQVFLNRFLRRVYSQGRVVLSGSDLLFDRSAESGNFRGTLTLTTYPLIPWQQDWTRWQPPYKGHSHRTFTMDASEGLYVATRFLIRTGKEPPSRKPIPSDPSESSQPPLKADVNGPMDYGPTTWLLPKCVAGDTSTNPNCPPKTRPPTWLSVIGDGQFWPVAMLDETTLPPPPQPCNKGDSSSCGPPLPSSLKPAVSSASFHFPYLPFPMPIRICLAFTMLWAVLHSYCCWRGSQTVSPRALAYFSPMSQPQHRVLIFLGSFAIALWSLALITLTGIFYRTETGFRHVGWQRFYYLLVFLFLLMALVGGFRNRQTPRRRRLLRRAGNKKKAAANMVHRLRREAREIEKHLHQKSVNYELLQQMQPTNAAKLDKLRGAGHPYESLKRRSEAVRKQLQKARKADEKATAIWWQMILVDLTTRVKSSIPVVPAVVAAFAVLVIAVGMFLHWAILGHLNSSNSVFTFWRSVNLFTGTSPLTPLLLLAAGFYGWFWFEISGMALFNQDRPVLPSTSDLSEYLPMFSRERAGDKVETFARPLCKRYLYRLAALLAVSVGLLGIASVEEFTLRTLGSTSYGRIFFVSLSVCIAVTLADAWQLLGTWGDLRWLLIYLDRLRLRRTLEALKGISWDSIWKMSGNVLEQRYRLISRQFESLGDLRNQLQDLQRTDWSRAMSFGEDLYKQLDNCDASSQQFAKWFVREYDQPGVWDMSALEAFQKELAKTAGMVASHILLPEWRLEKGSLLLDFSKKSADEKSNDKTAPPDSVPAYMRAAEEFFLLPYLGFIQNILGRIRTIALGMLCLFLGATFSVASYPFDPRPVLSGIFLFVFVVVGAAVFFVYAEIYRDATLSHITNTNPGELGVEFWFKLVAFGAGPLLGLLTAVFPEIAGFVGSWLQPGAAAIK